MQTLVVCNICGKRTGCHLVAVAKKCYFCWLPSCPFETVEATHTIHETCDSCKGKGEV